MKILNDIEKEKKDLMKYRLMGTEPTLVVAGLIEKTGKYLIAKRKKGNELVVDRWEFPGGKVEKDELEARAIEREMQEEFNLNVRAQEYVCSTIYEYPNRVVYLKLWHAIVLDDLFSMDKSDHSAYEWATLEEINNYDLCPADRILFDKIKG